MGPRFITGILIAVVIVMQAASLFAVAHSTKRQLHEQAKVAAVHQLDSTSKNLSKQVQQFLSPIASQVSISRQLIKDGLLNSRKDDMLALYFLSQLRSNKAMHAMYLGRYDGSFVAVSRWRTDVPSTQPKSVFRAKFVEVDGDTRTINWREYSLSGVLLAQWEDAAASEETDPRLRAWYQNAQSHAKPVWTNAFSLNNSQSQAIATSVNLHDPQNEDAGVLGVSVQLSELSALLSLVPNAHQANAVIFDSSLNEIAVSLPSSALLTGNPDASLVPWKSGESGKQVQHSIPPMDVHGNRLSSIDRDWFSKAGMEVNVQRRIRLFNGALQWRVLLKAPVSEMDAMQQSLVLKDLYQKIAIVLLPGVLALLIVIGLRGSIHRLYRRATVDYLTCALNREEFHNRLSKRLVRAQTGKGRPVDWIGVVLDLDGFKQINDQHGHAAGDDILRTVVSRLQQRVGRYGFVGRLGGDEFAVALKVSPGVDARLAVENLRRWVVEERIRSANNKHTIGMTAGVAVAKSQDTSRTLLDRADQALVAGKAVEKNTTYMTVPKVPRVQPLQKLPPAPQPPVMKQAS